MEEELKGMTDDFKRKKVSEFRVNFFELALLRLHFLLIKSPMHQVSKWATEMKYEGQQQIVCISKIGLLRIINQIGRL